MKINRRTMLKTMGSVALGLALPKKCGSEQRKPLVHIIVTDNLCDKGKVTRAWHVYWADHRNPESKINRQTLIYGRCYVNVKREVYYSVDELPEPVKHTVTLYCPHAPLIQYASFHCFRTYDLDLAGRIVAGYSEWEGK